MPDNSNTGHPLGYLPGRENTWLACTLRGDVPRIETLGILSAANLGGQPLPAADNRRRFQDLYRDLVVYGMRQIRGTFDGFVHPLVVANVARPTLMGLGAKFVTGSWSKRLAR